jgi:threonine/homoserine efflux transporter RhtA
MNDTLQADQNRAEDFMVAVNSLIVTLTLIAVGFGLGLVVAAGRAPRRLYTVGTIVALGAAVFWALEMYIFVFEPAFMATGSPG